MNFSSTHECAFSTIFFESSHQPGSHAHICFVRLPPHGVVIFHARCRGTNDAGLLQQRQLEYIGSVDSDANQRLFALYEKLAKKPTTLSIRSLGGDTNPGMELGAWVHAHKLNVRVMEFCFSSCANYVFPAAVKKTVSNFAMVGYHGGPGGPLNIQLDDALSATERKAFLDNIEKLRVQSGRREAEFYKTIGVRTDLSTLGQGDQYKPYYDKHPDALGWTYSLDDFTRLGVRDIKVINPPWKPGSASGQTPMVTIPIDVKPAPAS